MNEVVKLLPQIIYYISLGFVYTRFFRFVCISQNTSNREHIIWESLLVGYIISLLWNFISLRDKFVFLGMLPTVADALSVAIEICATLVIAYLIGMAWNSKFIDKVLDGLKILQSREQYIWHEMIDTKHSTWVDIRNNSTRERYYGNIHRCEAFSSKPIIVLRDFMYWRDYDRADAYEDHTGDNNTAIMLDTSKFDEIIFVYNEGNSVLPKGRIKTKNH